MTLPTPSAVIFIIAVVIFFAFAGSRANAMMLPQAFFVTDQQLADLKGKADQGDIDAAKKLAELYVSDFYTASCDHPDTGGVVLISILNTPFGTFNSTTNCHGKEIKTDYVEALKYLKPVADKGDAWAQTYMGWLYYQGKGVSQDYSSALKWFKLAADQDYPYAEDLIGRLYRDGHGVPQNYPLAAEYFKKASLQYVETNWRLASLYFTGGPGFPQDYEKAYFWQLIQWENPNHEELVFVLPEDKREMDLYGLFPRLTSEQVEKVRKQVKDYKMPAPTKWSPEGAKRRWLASQSNQTPSQPTSTQNPK